MGRVRDEFTYMNGRFFMVILVALRIVKSDNWWFGDPRTLHLVDFYGIN